ncbi:hypothetical protein [Nocardioides perillae]|uniref:Uncharacterized protein n=1 Tax=Nocardioides perillae TaxID=1119534 RepID=A0A7Y9RQ87_9ACTN|nr:hypothetical protein [Nocardioides perillae]NYG54531.1 hypothetical protein [Nocardioides perillae]
MDPRYWGLIGLVALAAGVVLLRSDKKVLGGLCFVLALAALPLMVLAPRLS